jgi:hypothetical protein
VCGFFKHTSIARGTSHLDWDTHEHSHVPPVPGGMR